MVRILHAKAVRLHASVVDGLVLANRGGDLRMRHRRKVDAGPSNGIRWTCPALRKADRRQRDRGKRRPPAGAHASKSGISEMGRESSSASHDAYPSFSDLHRQLRVNQWLRVPLAQSNPWAGAAMRGSDAPTQEDRKPATKTDNGWEDLDLAVVDYGRQFSVGTGRKDGYLAEPWLDCREAL